MMRTVACGRLIAFENGMTRTQKIISGRKMENIVHHRSLVKQIAIFLGNKEVQRNKSSVYCDFGESISSSVFDDVRATEIRNHK
jgi:hypothetical protein